MNEGNDNDWLWPVQRLRRTGAPLRTVGVDVDVERFGVTVDRDVGRGGPSLDWVEDLATDPVNTNHRGPVLSCGIVAVGGAGDGQPVRGALSPHQAAGPRPPRDGERLRGERCGRGVWLGGDSWLLVVIASCVLDTTEVPLHPHTDAVVSVGELQAGSVVVVEGENPASNSSEVLEAAVRSWAGQQSVRQWEPWGRTSSPLERELQSIWVILTEKDRENEGPAVTTVRTTGLLLDSPMSTYTKHHMGVCGAGSSA